MKTENSVLMKNAWESLRGKWATVIPATLIYSLVLVVQKIPKAGVILGLVVAGPMTLGFSMFILRLSRAQDIRLENIFDGFKNLGNAIGAGILKWVFVFLWSLLLIIPGIVALYSYSMTFYIMADDPTIGPLDAIRKSKSMMMGNKWKIFFLALRFLGWTLLSILTLGIGFLWLFPYATMANAKFYDDIKNSVEPVVVA